MVKVVMVVEDPVAEEVETVEADLGVAMAAVGSVVVVVVAMVVAG